MSDRLPVYRDDHREPMGHIRAADVDERVDARLRALRAACIRQSGMARDGEPAVMTLAIAINDVLANPAPREPATGGERYVTREESAVLREALKRSSTEVHGGELAPPRGVPMGGEDVTDGVRAQLRVRELEAERDALQKRCETAERERDDARALGRREARKIIHDHRGPSSAFYCKLLDSELAALAPSPAPDALPDLRPEFATIKEPLPEVRDLLVAAEFIHAMGYADTAEVCRHAAETIARDHVELAKQRAELSRLTASPP